MEKLRGLGALAELVETVALSTEAINAPCLAAGRDPAVLRTSPLAGSVAPRFLPRGWCESGSACYSGAASLGAGSSALDAHDPGSSRSVSSLTSSEWTWRPAADLQDSLATEPVSWKPWSPNPSRAWPSRGAQGLRQSAQRCPGTSLRWGLLLLSW